MKWLLPLVFSGTLQAGTPTEMVISYRPSNEILMTRNFEDFDHCRDDRLYIIALAKTLGTPVWVTCGKLVFE